VEQGDDGSTRIALALLGATLLSGGLLLLAAAIGEAPEARGAAHSGFPAMQHGGASEARTGSVLAIGALFGFVQIGFFGLCFALGMRRREGLGPVLRPLRIGLAAYAAVWAWLVASYLGYAAAPGETAIWLGFPAPTAILLFAFWPLPAVFAYLYLRHFDWVLDEARLERFRERLAELRDAPPESPRSGGPD
jgi:hypothetical protein